jgi:ABC-2 type transport system ATP-binding protein
MTVGETGWFTAGFHQPGFLVRYQELAARFHLDLGAKLKNLSKGEYAKVALALALAPDPEVLILDEPTSGLDLFVRREFLSSMVAQAGEGRTILISSHQIADVERVATHAAFLAGGRLILAAPIDELRRRIVRLRLRFESQPPDPTNLGRVLSKNGTGKQWEAVLQDPDPAAMELLRQAENVFDFETTGLGLEEMYAALMQGKEPGQ